MRFIMHVSLRVEKFNDDPSELTTERWQSG